MNKFIIVLNFKDGTDCVAPLLFETQEDAQTWAGIEMTQVDWEQVKGWKVWEARA